MHRYLFAFLWVTGLLFLSQPAISAAGESAHHGEKSFWADALGKLDLTPDQRKKLEALREEAASPERKKARAEIRELRKSLREKLTTTATEEELRALNAEIESRSVESRRSKFERMLKVRGILTPAQRQELLKLNAAKHRNKHPKRED